MSFQGWKRQQCICNADTARRVVTKPCQAVLDAAVSKRLRTGQIHSPTIPISAIRTILPGAIPRHLYLVGRCTKAK
jgi:hypothetical protein